MKVLVADDHDLIRMAIIKELSSLPEITKIYEAHDAAAVMVTLNSTTDIHLLILDLYMPGANHFELLNNVVENFPDISVIVLSATEDKNIMRRVIDLGASGFIAKSTPYKVMMNAISLVLSGGTYIPNDLFISIPHDSGINIELDSNLAENTSLDQLTKRQNEVLKCLSFGISNKEIARILDLSENTVKIHISTILRILNASNRTQAVIIASQIK